SARRVPTTLGAHGMEAVAQPPITFRLTPRPYQYEAVAALLAATAHDVVGASAPLPARMQGRAHRSFRRPRRPALAATPAHLGGGQAHGRPRTAHRGGPGAAWPRHAVGHDRPAGAVLRRALQGHRALSS